MASNTRILKHVCIWLIINVLHF